MKNNILCFLGLHKWSKWQFIKTIKTKIGSNHHHLCCKCEKCGKNKNYIGLCDKDIITGEKTPYTIYD